MPRGIYKRVKKVSQPVAVVKPTVSLEQAIDVVANAVSVVDGLDIKVWSDAVLFDYDGSRYTTTSHDAHKVLDAIKTLANCKYD